MGLGTEGELLAFYGTLMSAFGTLDQLGVRSTLRPLGPCRIRGRLFDMGEWPSLTLEQGVVHGELFEVLDPVVFARLDPFEGYDPEDREHSSYLRLRVALLAPEVSAWVYVANGPLDGRPRIASGSWREHVAGSAGGGAADA